MNNCSALYLSKKYYNTETHDIHTGYALRRTMPIPSLSIIKCTEYTTAHHNNFLSCDINE